MKQINGPGATIAFLAILAASLLAESIPAMLICMGVAVCGVVWDYIKIYHEKGKSK